VVGRSLLRWFKGRDTCVDYALDGLHRSPRALPKALVLSSYYFPKTKNNVPIERSTHIVWTTYSNNPDYTCPLVAAK
jgi:hypothetical protein